MAVRRRPPAAVAPAELVYFDPAEWPGGEWWERFELWGRARMEYARQHPGSVLGSRLDVLREHRRLMDEHRRGVA